MDNMVGDSVVYSDTWWQGVDITPGEMVAVVSQSHLSFRDEKPTKQFKSGALTKKHNGKCLLLTYFIFPCGHKMNINIKNIKRWID